MGYFWTMGSLRRQRRLHVVLSLISVIVLLTFYVHIYPNLQLSPPSNKLKLPLHQHEEHYDNEQAIVEDTVQEVADDKPQRSVLLEKTLQKELPNLPVVLKKVDDSSKTDQDILLERLQDEVPNLPVSYIEKNKRKKMYSRKDCARLPKMSSIEFNNYYWQSLISPKRIFQLFSAYYDNRTAADDTPCVRIISMTNYKDPEGNYCQFWFEKGEQPIIVKVKTYHYIWREVWGDNEPGSYQPYLITCQLPDKHPQVPAAVSIVAKECDNATNLLKVGYDHVEPKRDFVVCVKGLDFPDKDISVRLVEWIELLSLLGNDMIYFYNLQVNPNVTKLLNHYERLNLVRVVPMTLAGSQPNHPILQHSFLKENSRSKRHNEMIVYNDCFYRNMNSYKYVVILDIDEVIMPIGNFTSWKTLIPAVEKEDWRKNKKHHAALYARNVYFLDNHLHQHSWSEGIPKYLHMLQHVYKSANNSIPPDYYVKSFFNTALTFLTHNHLPISCLNSTWCFFPIPHDFGQMQHYRSGCEATIGKDLCLQLMESSVQDDSIWRFKDELVDRSLRTLNTLGYSSEYLATLTKEIEKY